jgi:hypothetical protein
MWLSWVELCPTKIHKLKSYPPIPLMGAVFGNSEIADVIPEDEVMLEECSPQIQYD